MDFIVGMCSYDGGAGSKDFGNAGVLDRLHTLKLSIVQAFGYNLDDTKLYCFVAPEFFFGSVALPKSEFKTLVSALRELYAARNLILVPGSMVTYSGSKKDALRTDYLNRVPVLYGGQFMEYDKSSWGGEYGALGVGQFRQGTTDNDFKLHFRGRSYRFAVEVCAEHDLGVLAQRKPNKMYDVHIVTANTVSHKATNARANHYVLHCNASNSAPQNRWNSGNGSMMVFDQNDAPIPPTRAIGDEVSVWALLLP